MSDQFVFPIFGDDYIETEVPLLPAGSQNVELNNIEPAICDCGVDSVGGGNHSNWCPKGKD